MNKKYVTFLFLGILLSNTTYSTLYKEDINLNIKGNKSIVSSNKETVRDLLDEQNVNYDEDDIIKPSLDEKLKNGMNIEFIDIKKTKKIEYTNIDFETKTVDDNNLLKGKTEIYQEGKLGKQKETYENIYENGKLIESNLLTSEIEKSPVEKVVKKGTKEEIIEEVIVKNNEVQKEIQEKTNEVSIVNQNNTETNDINKDNKIHVEATAYSGHSITATGTKPKWGTIAVDPTVIPYGTKVYIPKFDMVFTAEDCGGAIKGNKIDIFMNSKNESYTWGRRNIEIYILE